MQAWQFLSHERVDYLLINTGADHVLEVVQRQIVLYQAAEGPKCFLFSHDFDQAPHDEVEALAVAYVYVAVSVQSAHPLDHIEHLLA